ncbi:transcription factor SPEECHLESS-like [Rutidosis leptorrhynchoides]|uniref:transcription factor SPEECHLESS-like n=1 Tax=Rutidosis leptorrhynchoides TaxID=125765 RepID=UPI003A9947CA
MVGEFTCLPNFYTSSEQYDSTKFVSNGLTSLDDIFSILEALEGVSDEFTSLIDESADCGMKDNGLDTLVSQNPTSLSGIQERIETEIEMCLPKNKRRKVMEEGCDKEDGHVKNNHVIVERNRRKQMNEHLTVLRSLMPCFYVKRGDQASIIGGVINYITELQQVLQSLEAKKQRKVYSDVLSPKNISSPRTLPLSPRIPPLSPRPSLPISPRTPQSVSPYKHRLPSATSYLSSSSMANTTPSSPCNSTSNSGTINELFATSKSSVADVEVKFSGPNLVLKMVSPRLPCQATKIMSVLEDLSLEILQATINTVDETMVNTFTIKVNTNIYLNFIREVRSSTSLSCNIALNVIHDLKYPPRSSFT